MTNPMPSCEWKSERHRACGDHGQGLVVLEAPKRAARCGVERRIELKGEVLVVS